MFLLCFCTVKTTAGGCERVQWKCFDVPFAVKSVVECFFMLCRRWPFAP